MRSRLSIGIGRARRALRALMGCALAAGLLTSGAGAGAAHGEMTGFVRAHGHRFELEGRAFRFVGFNLRNLVNYGYWDAAGGSSTTGHIDENLNEAQRIGARVLRIFVALNNSTAPQQIERLQALLDKMRTRDLRAIVVLTDLYSSSWAPFHPAGDDGYYTDQGGYVILTHPWFAGDYTLNYVPFVEAMVTAFKDDPAIFAWEIGNELKDNQSPGGIIPFIVDMAARIKAIDRNHMLGTGFLSWDHQGLQTGTGVDVYNDPNIDFITLHHYNQDNAPQNRIVYSRVGKPLILEEFGYSLGDRAGMTDHYLREYIDGQAAQGFMNWGFQAQGYDTGDADHQFGIDRFIHGSEYDTMTALYQDWATTLALRNELLPTRREPTGENVARQATANDEADGATGAAIDGDLATQWEPAAGAGSHWLQLDLGRQALVNGAALRMRGLTGAIEENLAAFELQTAPAPGGPWSTLEAVDNGALFGRRTIIVQPARRMRYVRLVIPAGAPARAVPELEIYEDLTLSARGWEQFE